jgi:hypothetical protein
MHFVVAVVGVDATTITARLIVVYVMFFIGTVH